MFTSCICDERHKKAPPVTRRLGASWRLHFFSSSVFAAAIAVVAAPSGDELRADMLAAVSAELPLPRDLRRPLKIMATTMAANANPTMISMMCSGFMGVSSFEPSAPYHTVGITSSPRARVPLHCVDSACSSPFALEHAQCANGRISHAHQ